MLGSFIFLSFKEKIAEASIILSTTSLEILELADLTITPHFNTGIFFSFSASLCSPFQTNYILTRANLK